ncbi:MAG: TetR/AcrR family transcriptional regulator [Alphaproteobacteria bacterium]|nr:TetR/AcrR family transcriptional regulator [Alphaproteobacteria bacterium]
MNSVNVRVPVPGKREQTKVANREAIIAAARKVFAELGFGATTVRDIIRATDLASGTFYNYFKSKEEVFEALQDESALRIRPRLRAERVRARNIEEFIAGTFETFFDYVAQDRADFHVARKNTDILRVRMASQQVIAGFEELREDIKVAVDSGLLPRLDPDFLTAAMVGVAFEIGEMMLARDPVDPKAAAEFATSLFLNGLRPRP